LYNVVRVDRPYLTRSPFQRYLQNLRDELLKLQYHINSLVARKKFTVLVFIFMAA
jgi:hypothetical protein